MVSEVLRAQAFGTFAILDSGDAFVQTANVSKESWVLEFRLTPEIKLYRADGQFTLLRVEEVFLAFLRGDSSWRAQFNWSQIVLEG